MQPFDQYMAEVRELLSDMTEIRFDAGWNTYWRAMWMLDVHPLTAVTNACKRYREERGMPEPRSHWFRLLEQDVQNADLQGAIA